MSDDALRSDTNDDVYIFLESCRVTDANLNVNLGVRGILKGCKGHSVPPPIPSRWRRAEPRPRGGAEHRLGHFGTSRSNLKRHSGN